MRETGCDHAQRHRAKELNRTSCCSLIGKSKLKSKLVGEENLESGSVPGALNSVGTSPHPPAVSFLFYFVYFIFIFSLFPPDCGLSHCSQTSCGVRSSCWYYEHCMLPGCASRSPLSCFLSEVAECTGEPSIIKGPWVYHFWGSEAILVDG